jgi:hypothetical protein
MPYAQTCLRCGHEGTDVRITLVDLEREARLDGAEIRRVALTLASPVRHTDDVVLTDVPERYATEYRCRDHRACDERYAALQLGVQA